MPGIHSDDIKLLESARMADTSDGGGGATGIEIVDGQTHNIFPPISTDNRAQGAFHTRKVFGLAHTDNTELLLGGGFSVMEPPEDEKVSVVLFQTPGWFDERTDAISLVERYRVKGPRLVCRIADVHYEGTKILALYNVADSGFPNPGDTIFLRNPDGTEQPVRVLKVTRSTAVIQTDDSGPWTVYLCTCQLNKVLAFELQGKPIQKPSPAASTTAWVYSESPAQGAMFYGVKRLGVSAAIGDRSIYLDGGIMINLVPASTVPEPVIDQYPLIQRPTLSRTAQSALTIPAQSLALGPGAVLQLPTAVEPGSLTMTHGGTAFTTEANGNLLQGATVVGTVDHTGRSITMLGTAPNYGTQNNSITYRPATRTGATAHSIGIEVTSANQSAAWVRSLAPTAAPGTLSFSYMANGTWYELTDDGTGKISGADSSYGTGQLNYVTGSMAVTAGALPDVGSMIIIMWGEADSAEQATGLPTRAWCYLPLDAQPDGNVVATWSRGGTNYSATVAPNGTVTGPAQARPVERRDDGSYHLPFSPDTLPDGAIHLVYTPIDETPDFVNNGGGSYTLNGGNPIKPGSVRFRCIGTSAEAGSVNWQGGNQVYDCYSQGTEIYARGVGVIGTVNNTTGAMVLSHGSVSVSGYRAQRKKYEYATSGGI